MQSAVEKAAAQRCLQGEVIVIVIGGLATFNVERKALKFLVSDEIDDATDCIRSVGR